MSFIQTRLSCPPFVTQIEFFVTLMIPWGLIFSDLIKLLQSDRRHYRLRPLCVKSINWLCVSLRGSKSLWWISDYQELTLGTRRQKLAVVIYVTRCGSSSRSPGNDVVSAKKCNIRRQRWLWDKLYWACCYESLVWELPQKWLIGHFKMSSCRNPDKDYCFLLA